MTVTHISPSLAFACCLFAAPAAEALTVLGVGTGALLGGDLTGPEDDGVGDAGAGSGFAWLSTSASSKNFFGGEGALEIFAGAVDTISKWCCDDAPQWVAVDFGLPYVLTHFTLAAGNDYPGRDPKDWLIEGSNDGTTWDIIFHWDAGVSSFSQRGEVVRFDGEGVDFAKPAAYRQFRYRVVATVGIGHQIGELELFGEPPPVINRFAVDRPQIAAGDAGDAGDAILLSWDADPAVTGLTIDNGVGAVDGLGEILIAPGPASTTTYTLTATNATGAVLSQVSIGVAVPGLPMISEFMANNDGALVADEDGASSDWIEIHNPSGATALLAGYYLTDDPTDLQKWEFPARGLPPGEFLILFASGKDRRPVAGELHTNFSLGAGGEYLALVKPEGASIVTEFAAGGSAYPEQEAGVSFGLSAAPAQAVYFDTATPGASIRFTTDGFTLSPTAGTFYTGPISIDHTIPVRAIAYLDEYRSTNIDTQTYLFVDDVISQTADNEGGRHCRLGEVGIFIGGAFLDGLPGQLD